MVNPAKRAAINDICGHWWVNLGYANPPTEDVPTGHPIDFHVLERSLTVSSDSDSDLQDSSNRPNSKKQKPLKSILKKPKDSSTSSNSSGGSLKGHHSDSGFYNGVSDWTVCQIEPEVAANSTSTSTSSDVIGSLSGSAEGLKRLSGPNAEDDVVFKDLNNESQSQTGNNANTSSSNNTSLSGTSPNRSDSVFDSKRQPKRGILKNKHKQRYQGADSGCVLEDINISEYFDSENLKTLKPAKTESSESKSKNRNSSGAYDESELDALLNDLTSISLSNGLLETEGSVSSGVATVSSSEQLKESESLKPEQLEESESLKPKDQASSSSPNPEKLKENESLKPDQLKENESLTSEQLKENESLTSEQLKESESLTSEQLKESESLTSEQLKESESLEPKDQASSSSLTPEQLADDPKADSAVSPPDEAISPEKAVAGGEGSSPESDEPLSTSTPARRQLKGILKWHGKYSSTPDPTWRYSIGSQSSNSSGDILDFSYDSGDCESVLVPGDPTPPDWSPPVGPTHADWSPPVATPSSTLLPSDEGCVDDVYDEDIYSHLVMDDFLLGEAPVLHRSAANAKDAVNNDGLMDDDVMNKINMLDDAYYEEGIHRETVTADLFHFSEVQQVYEGALKICQDLSQKVGL